MSLNLIYQFWVHTEHVPKLGPFEWIFVSPSNHRVHHGRNKVYVDKNYGGVFILWDRIFGSFQEELAEEPVAFGLRKPLNSWNPVWANVHVYWRLILDFYAMPGALNKLKLLVQAAWMARRHTAESLQTRGQAGRPYSEIRPRNLTLQPESIRRSSSTLTVAAKPCGLAQRGVSQLLAAKRRRNLSFLLVLCTWDFPRGTGVCPDLGNSQVGISNALSAVA